MADCFLIADEVGLGKTKSARTVMCEIARRKQKYGGHVHAIYIASSVDLAQQNMTNDFLKKFGCQKENYKGLSGFQAANAVKAMQVFYDTDNDKYGLDDTPCSAADTEIQALSNARDFRLSLYTPDMSRKNGKDAHVVMQLSPKTSFFVPGAEAEYNGSESERDKLREEFKKLCDNWISIDYQQILHENIADLQAQLKLAALSFFHNDTAARDKVEAIAKDSFDSNTDNFYAARLLRSHASAAMFKPDLIILDEFQRYPQVLSDPPRGIIGYSVKTMVDYLKRCYPRTPPKILLLSATPYKFDPDAMGTIKWTCTNDSINVTAQKSAKGSENDPCKDFAELERKMIALGAEPDKDKQSHIQNRVARTERARAHKQPPEDKTKGLTRVNDIGKVVRYQREYLNPLVLSLYTLCSEEEKKNIKTACGLIGTAPEFWRFSHDYKALGSLDDALQKRLLQPGTLSGNGYNVYANLGLQQLEEAMFPNNALPQLWVPPVSTGQVGVGKTLVFTRHTVCTRAVAYFCDRMAQDRVKNYTAFDNATFEISACLLIGSSFNDDEIKALDNALPAFFARPFVRRVIAADNPGETSYTKAIIDYCQKHAFCDMLLEFKAVCGAENFKSRMEKMFGHTPAPVVELCLHGATIGKQFAPIEYTEMFVCDDNKNGTAKDDSEKKYETFPNSKNTPCESLAAIRDQFNSPLYPMVLVARSSAQEGFNLQYYGDKLMHWQTADNVNAFLQREGRLDRPNSLIFRNKIWQWVQTNVDNPRNIKTYAEAKEKFDQLYKPEDSGLRLEPMWYLKLPDKDIRIRQMLPLTMYDKVFEPFLEQLQAAEMYPAFNPDPTKDLCPYFDLKSIVNELL